MSRQSPRSPCLDRIEALGDALLVGTCAACFDLARSFSPGAHRLGEIEAFGASLAAGIALFTGLGLAARLLARMVAGRRLASDAGRLALAAGVLFFVVLTSQLGALKVPSSLTDWVRLPAAAGIAVLVAGWLGQRFRDATAVLPARVLPLAGGLILAGPTLVLTVFGCAWFRIYGDLPGAPDRPLGLLLLLAAACAGTSVAAALRLHRAGSAVAAAALLVTTAAGFLLSKAPATEAPMRSLPPGPRHVVLITIDTFRADALDPRAAGSRTPQLARLASDGVRFARAFSAGPWTKPGMASLLTGLSPLVHGATRRESSLPDAVPTLAESMREAGYRTAAIGINAVLWPSTGLARGFDSYDWFPRRWLGRSLGSQLLEAWLPDRYGAHLDTDGLTRRAVAFLDRYRDEPFFLWLHYLDPHLGWDPPADLVEGEAPEGLDRSWDSAGDVVAGIFAPNGAERSWLRSLYQAEVRDVDRNIGRLIAALEKLGLYQDALIVLASDHGEELWDGGGIGHGHKMHDAVLAVPLVFKLPGSSRQGVVQTPISTMRMGATVLELCGVEDPIAALRAPSLLPLIEHPDGAVEAQPLLASGMLYFEDRSSLRIDGFKYVVWHEEGVDEREALYDLAADPAERNSVADRHPEMLARVRAELRKQRGIAAEQRAALGIEAESEIDLGEDQREALRAMGYVR